MTLQAPFAMGLITATPAALAEFGAEFCAACLCRHHAGDWGDIDPADRGANERALQSGARLLSVYRRGDRAVWVVTDAEGDDCERHATTVMTPEDY